MFSLRFLTGRSAQSESLGPQQLWREKDSLSSRQFHDLCAYIEWYWEMVNILSIPGSTSY